MKDIDIYIEADGTMQAVYSDALADLLDGEVLEISRASNVEPARTFGVRGKGWLADLRPVGGPLLGLPGELEHGIRPFPTRQAALDAELVWLGAAMESGQLRSES